MKNLSKVLALVLVIAMVFSMAVSAGAATSFKDDAAINYDEAVQLLSALDVLNGYDTNGDGVGDTFNPGANITRAELTVMISYLVANSDSEYGLYNDIAKLNADYKALCTFADSKNHWAAGFIAFCAGNGYLSGRAADKFDPDAEVTVAEAAVILLRVMGYDAAKEEYGTTAGTVKGYNLQLDARNAGLLNGMENVNFFAAATREQVAQLVMNALDGYVVVYNNYAFTLIQDNKEINWSNIGIFQSNTATMTANKLVEYCFRHVAKINTTNEFGYAGHQWVTYNFWTAQVGPYGDYIALTDVFVDDAIMSQFKGGTPMSVVAAAMGLSTKSAPVIVEKYTNGALTTSAAAYNYTQLAQGFVADNATLVVVRDYDRNVGGTYFKLMTYNEYFAKATRSAGTITDKTSAHYGEYYFEFTYYVNGVAQSKNYVFSANKDAYVHGGYYLVVPNANPYDYGYPNYSNINDVKFFLSITPAQISDAVKVTGAQTNDLYNSDYVYVGASKYNMSAQYVDGTKTGFAFNKAVHFAFNSAGYVIATLDPAAAPGTVLETGYVYLDKFEYAVTVTGTSSLINQSAYTWSAQAKAQVYFPTATGNSVATVIDVTTKKTTVAATGEVTGGVAYIDNTNTAAEDFIALPKTSTSSYWDVTGQDYVYGNTVVNGNVRVYDVTFDGWYKYEKQLDGTYVLVAVQKDTMATYGGLDIRTSIVDDAKLYNAYYLTSATAVNTFTWNLSTKTASVATVTGYAAIPAGNYGVVDTKTGVVGGEVTVAKDRVATFSQFAIVDPTNAYNNAYYAGKGDYNTYLAKWEHFFYINGQKVLFFAAADTIVDGVAVKAENVSLTKGAIYDLVMDASGNLKVVTTETKVSGKIDTFKYVDGANYLHYAPAANNGTIVAGLVEDANGLVKVEFNTAKVYNTADGSVTTIGAKDSVFYVFDNGKVAEIWVTKPGNGAIPDPMKPQA